MKEKLNGKSSDRNLLQRKSREKDDGKIGMTILPILPRKKC
ncbi:hypothetical protein CHK_3194 [Christensenella hongkongensis]|uniref:Uncharacterized protein n=1 Tax=Christensenella hongkongensis TaxID=270498 RepID=A0A0M2NFX9_9FIRM|nr:hypothetical protein CHK_3194 [Christensenella hongkongensis]